MATSNVELDEIRKSKFIIQSNESLIRPEATQQSRQGQPWNDHEVAVEQTKDKSRVKNEMGKKDRKAATDSAGMENELQQQRGKVTTSDQVNEEQQVHITQLEEELNFQSSIAEQVKNDLNREQSSHDTTKRVSDMIGQDNNLRESLQRLRNGSQNLNKSNVEKSQRITELTMDVQDRDLIISRQQTLLQSYRDQAAISENEICDNDHTIAGLEFQAAHDSERIVDLQAEVASLQQAIVKLNEKLETLEEYTRGYFDILMDIKEMFSPLSEEGMEAI